MYGIVCSDASVHVYRARGWKMPVGNTIELRSSSVVSPLYIRTLKPDSFLNSICNYDPLAATLPVGAVIFHPIRIASSLLFVVDEAIDYARFEER